MAGRELGRGGERPGQLGSDRIRGGCGVPHDEAGEVLGQDFVGLKDRIGSASNLRVKVFPGDTDYYLDLKKKSGMVEGDIKIDLLTSEIF